MTDRIVTTFREIFLSWDRYTALQFTAPMTQDLLRATAR